MSELVLLTAEQAAAKLMIHPKTLYRNTDIPRVQIGSKVRWVESQIDQYILSRMTRKPEPKKRPKKRSRKTMQTVMRQDVEVRGHQLTEIEG